MDLYCKKRYYLKREKLLLSSRSPTGNPLSVCSYVHGPECVQQQRIFHSAGYSGGGYTGGAVIGFVGDVFGIKKRKISSIIFTKSVTDMV